MNTHFKINISITNKFTYYNTIQLIIIFNMNKKNNSFSNVHLFNLDFKYTTYCTFLIYL